MWQGLSVCRTATFSARGAGSEGDLITVHGFALDPGHPITNTLSRNWLPGSNTPLWSAGLPLGSIFLSISMNSGFHHQKMPPAVPLGHLGPRNSSSSMLGGAEWRQRGPVEFWGTGGSLSRAKHRASPPRQGHPPRGSPHPGARARLEGGKLHSSRSQRTASTHQGTLCFWGAPHHFTLSASKLSSLERSFRTAAPRHGVGWESVPGRKELERLTGLHSSCVLGERGGAQAGAPRGSPPRGTWTHFGPYFSPRGWGGERS